MGPLPLALALSAIFSWSSLMSLRETPFPLAVALTLLVLPPALLLRLLLASPERGEAVHAASLLTAARGPAARARGTRLARAVATRGRLGAVFVLFLLAYADLAAGAVLAPAGTTPVFVRLHNLAHYGRSAALSAMTAVAAAAPLAVLGAALAVRRLRAGGGIT